MNNKINSNLAIFWGSFLSFLITGSITIFRAETPTLLSIFTGLACLRYFLNIIMYSYDDIIFIIGDGQKSLTPTHFSMLMVYQVCTLIFCGLNFTILNENWPALSIGILFILSASSVSLWLGLQNIIRYLMNTKVHDGVILLLLVDIAFLMILGTMLASELGIYPMATERIDTLMIMGIFSAVLVLIFQYMVDYHRVIKQMLLDTKNLLFGG